MDITSRAHQLEVSMARFIRSSEHQPQTDISLQEIIDIEDIKEIIKPFYASTGLGVGLFDKQHKLVAGEGWQKICTHFHQKHPESHKSCAESERFFKNSFEPGKIISYKCNNGLWDVAYPIYVDEELIGSISFGQFFYQNDEIDKAFFVEQAKKFNFDLDEYLSQLKSVPILKKEQIENFVQLFVKIVEKMAKVETI